MSDLGPEDLVDKALAWDMICKKNDIIESLKQRIAELEAIRMDYFHGHKADKERIAELLEALENLVSAARGMPISYDNLCQGGLDHAIELAEQALTSRERSDG